MNLDEAKNAVGLAVMAHDSSKLIKGPHRPHGPYVLLRVTKGGMCELDRDPNKHGTQFVKPTLLSLPVASNVCSVCGHIDAADVLKCDECGYDMPPVTPDP